MVGNFALKPRLLIAALAAALPAPYLFANWWRFLPLSVAIVLGTRALQPEKFRSLLGLSGSATHWACAGGLLFAAYVGSSTLIEYLANTQGMRLDPASAYLWRPLFPFFQTFNEEILFRALWLELALERTTRTIAVSLGSALFFTLLHAGFFPLTQGGPLSASACLSLFFFAVGANGLYLRFRSVALPWAIHVGWNLSLFGFGNFVWQANGATLSQSAAFNAFVGSSLTVSLGAGLAALGLWACWPATKLTDRQNLWPLKFED